MDECRCDTGVDLRVDTFFSFWRYGLHRGHSLSTGGEGFDASGMFIGKSPAGMSGMSVSRVPVGDSDDSSVRGMLAVAIMQETATDCERLQSRRHNRRRDAVLCGLAWFYRCVRPMRPAWS